MARGTSLKRGQVVDALHAGMAKAARRFQRWSGGESVAEWGVESSLTAYCAEAIPKAAKTEGGKFDLTVEQNFGELLRHSGRKDRPGRPSNRKLALEAGPNRRIDLAIWNADGVPRLLIELKR